jgi:RHS repeat-associated protein
MLCVWANQQSSGSISGTIDVTTTGAATYAIPIDVVPGTNGMQPNISIVYNSQSGIGLLGSNWQLEGMSSIRRIPQNLFIDNNITCVNLNTSDRFTLDGNRLIEVLGNYGDIGTKYNTEIETFRVITSIGNSTGGLDYFEAVDDKGTVYEYGREVDSKQMLGTIPLAWFVNKVTDCEGNYMNYKYSSSSGQIVLTEIAYTGNSGANLSPYAKIIFSYSDKNQQNTSFIRGQKIVRTKLLTGISTYYMGTLVKSYNFEYDYELLPRLNTITLTGENNKQLNPIVISWGTSVIDPISYVTDVEGAGYIPLRYDSDKCADFFYCKPPDAPNPDDPTSYEWRIISNDCKGNLSEDIFGYIAFYSTKYPAFPADIDGDGSDEIVYAQNEPGGMVSFHYVHFLPESPYFETNNMNVEFTDNSISQILPGDLNGDGKDDIIFYTPAQTPKLNFWGLNDNVIHNEIILSSQVLKVQDNNNNRKAEIMIDMGANTSIYEYDNITKKFKHYVSDEIAQMGNNYLYFGDFNGDGLKDVLRISKYGSGNNHSCNVNINVNSTNGMWSTSGTSMPLEITFNIDNNSLISTPPLIGDMNGDGWDDIIVTVKQLDNKIRLDVFYSDGYMDNQFLYHKVSYIVNSFSQPNLTDQSNYFCADMNGDGRSDILYMKSVDQKINLFFHKNEQFELMQNLVDGYGAKIVLSYVMSSSPYTFYTSNFESRIYFPLLSEISASNGIGDEMNRTSYEYYDVLYSLKRISFLGFKTFKSTNYALGLKTESTYAMNTDFDNIDLTKRKYYRNGYILNEVITPKYLNWGKRFLPYNDIYEKLDLLTGVKTYTDTDVFSDGRIKNSFTKYSRQYNDKFLSSSNTAYQYQDIILPNSKTVKKLANTTLTEKISASTESLQYSTYFNYLNGRLGSIVNSNNSSSSTNTTSYSSYNSFGNPKTIVRSATNVPSQTDQIEYDVTGRFETSLTNALLQTASFTYYGATGSLNTSSDINGLITTYFYDEFGRNRLQQNPDGTSVTISRQWQVQSWFPDAVYSVITQVTASPKEEIFFDKLNREIFSYVEGVGYTQSVYDAKGQISKISLPYPVPTTPESSKIWTTYTYYKTGRLETKTGPYLREAYTYDGIDSDETNITVSDLLRTTKVKKSYDLPDRIVKLEDAGGIITYTYEYKKVNSKLSKVKKITYNSNIITLVQDLNNNQISISDPNSGTISSSFDAYNRIVSNTDANGNQTSYLYDLLNRVTEENHSGSNEPDRKFVYNYDNAPGKGKGKLYYKTVNGALDEMYYYDALGRIETRRKIISSTPYHEYFDYNTIGQLVKYTFPDSFRVKYVYNNLGELSYIYDDSNNDLICEIGRNRFRKHAKRILGNQTGINYIYNSLGMITNITSGNLDSNPPPEELNTDDNSSVSYSIGDQYRNLTYTYNTIGLIDSRKDTRINQYETYIYDKQDRLTDFNVGTIQPFTTNLVTYGINAWGNITTNTLVGDYSYTSEKPYAVWRIIPNTKCTISPSTCESKFNNLNLPSTIVEGKYSYAIDYGSDGNRRSAVLTKTENGSTTTVKTTRYISPSCEIEISPSGTKYIDYIMTDQGVVAIRTKAGTQQNLYYVHADHLGTYNFVMDASKNIIQSCHFDPWGNRKLYNNWSQNNTASSFLFSRGFTSHEHLDVFKIINMNARLYDPVIGRFFSPDPIIQDYEATQTLNRYSYCQNNPVNRVDLNGALNAPIYDENANFLGTDDEGLQGKAIVMNKANFKQGMSHKDALSKSLGAEGLIGEVATAKLLDHFNGLKDRPDYDGYLTLSEANKWYREGKGQPLFTSLAKIDLSGILSLGENYVGKEGNFNLLLNSNSVDDALVYGSITLKRYSEHQVRAYADRYDFEMHNAWNPLNWPRNAETVFGKSVAGKGQKFNINIYGSKKLTPILPWIK